MHACARTQTCTGKDKQAHAPPHSLIPAPCWHPAPHSHAVRPDLSAGSSASAVASSCAMRSARACLRRCSSALCAPTSVRRSRRDHAGRQERGSAHGRKEGQHTAGKRVCTQQETGSAHSSEEGQHMAGKRVSTRQERGSAHCRKEGQHTAGNRVSTLL